MDICVYGASSNAIDRFYTDGAREFGKALAGAGMGLVFGGGASGVMGAAALGVLEAGGEVTGVAPSFFNVDGILLEGCADSCDNGDNAGTQAEDGGALRRLCHAPRGNWHFGRVFRDTYFKTAGTAHKAHRCFKYKRVF